MCLPLKMCILHLQISCVFTCRCAFCSYRLSVFTPADVHFAATNISSCSSRLLAAIANHTRKRPSHHLAQRTCTRLVHFLALWPTPATAFDVFTSTSTSTMKMPISLDTVRLSLTMFSSDLSYIVSGRRGMGNLTRRRRREQFPESVFSNLGVATWTYL